MRLLVALILLAIIGCAVLSFNQHKPFALLVDAKANEAAANQLLTPCPLGPANVPPLENPEYKT